MALKYGKNKYFIGIVKFFDKYKDFGFIASNSCGMDEVLYEQDFYVNKDSFIEPNAAKEGAIVVFQVELQNKGRTRAVNVRYVKKTEDDQIRVLEYYGHYEKITIKDRTINIFNLIAKPRSMEIELVRKRIETIERTPKATVKHFSFYVSHFKEKDAAQERYIFDRDFERSQKNDWITLFSALTDDEKLEIIKAFPSTYRYIGSELLNDAITSYIARNHDNQKELSYILSLTEIISIDFNRIAKEQIGQIADNRILALLKQYENDCMLWKTIDDDIRVFSSYSGIIFRIKDDKHWLKKRLGPLLKHASRSFDAEIDKLLIKIRHNKFASLVEDFSPSSSIEQFDSLIKSFNALQLEEKVPNEALLNAIKAYFTQTAEDCRYEEVLKIFNTSAVFGETFIGELKDIFSPLAMKNFCKLNDCNNTQKLSVYLKQIESCKHLFAHNDLATICEYYIGFISNSKRLDTYATFINYRSCFKDVISEHLQKQLSASLSWLLVQEAAKSLTSKCVFSQFFTRLELYKNIISNQDMSTIINYVNSLVADSSLEILSELSKHTDFTKELPEKFFKDKIKGFVNKWNYDDYDNCFYKPDEIFTKFQEIKEFIVVKGIELIYPYKLNEPFSGIESCSTYISVESSNCSFLKNMIKFIGKDGVYKPLKDYISSRTPAEQIILFDNGVISQLPSTITEDIINHISIDEVLAPTSRWYNPPKLKNELYIKALSSTTDLFPLIEKRLAQIEQTPENVSLVVLLVELLKVNSPKEPDKNWLYNFTYQIQALSRRHSDNHMLQIVLWAVYLKTDRPELPIKDVFPYLPPYLQIKLLKWLFHEKIERRINFTARSLSNYLGGSNKAICFAVAIALEYLMLREDNPEATLTHNIMLRILIDREDHSEWIGIRQFVHDCNGRYNRECTNEYDRWGNPKERWHFYNGIAYKKDGKIVIFVPRHMVNQNGEQQNKYNNKEYDSICEYIKIAFSNAQIAQSNQNTFFYIPEEYDLQIRSLVRVYNLRYGSLHNELVNFSINNSENEIRNFCECRLSDKADHSGFAFYWCGNHPCFRNPVRYHLNSEWSDYTILDFLRILEIPTDYTNKHSKTTRFGYYIILSSYLRSFAKFYEHLKCRGCGKLMKPAEGVSNFATRAVTEFSCDNTDCSKYGIKVYLNHCFNKNNCDAIIDSRDSKQCPNGQYICPECGACCSTKNFAIRLQHLHQTGGYISPKLKCFVHNDLGHWEKNIFYCYKCGNQMVNGECSNCHFSYKH